MESFYVEIVINKKVKIDKVIEFVAEKYVLKPYTRLTGKLVKKRHVVCNKFTVENKILVEFVTRIDENIIINVESCLSNFSSNICFLYDFITYLKSFDKYLDIMIGGKCYKFNQYTTENFLKIIENFYREKYEIFERKYTDLKIDVLPGDDFYKMIKQLK